MLNSVVCEQEFDPIVNLAPCFFGSYDDYLEMWEHFPTEVEVRVTKQYKFKKNSLNQNHFDGTKIDRINLARTMFVSSCRGAGAVMPKKLRA